VLEEGAPARLVLVFALDRPVAPLLDRPINLPVQLRHRRRRHPRAPQGLREVLNPPNRNAGQIHLDQSFLNRALTSPIALNDRRLKCLLPKLGHLQPHLAGFGLQLALVMAGPGIASRLATLVALRIAQPIRLRVQQRVQRLLHATRTRGRGGS